MTMYHQHGPSQGRQREIARERLISEVRQRSAIALASLEEECRDDPNLQRIDAFLAEDGGFDDPSDEV